MPTFDSGWHSRLVFRLPVMAAQGGYRSLPKGAAHGHHGAGDLELAILNLGDLEKAKPLILKSSEED